MPSASSELKELEKHSRIFNLIAPIYNLFFQSQLKNYRSILKAHQHELQLEPGAAWEVLDIGCGTGAYLASFAELGYHGTGVDFSAPMLKAARKSTGQIPGLNLEFRQADATQGLPFPDQNFDLVIAAYVLHGLKKNLRRKIYAEAKRLARRSVIFYDYNQNRHPLTDMVEWAEGGDYFNFIKVAEQEMQEHFTLVKRFEVGPHSTIYLCSN